MNDFTNIGQTMHEYLNKGAFLVAGKDKPNVMTVSWGMIGVMWRKKIVVVPVRESRYTKEFLDKEGEFTLSVPFEKMSKEIAFCGTKSGREVDKFEALGLKKVKGEKVDTYKVGGCDAYFECRVLAKIPLTADMLPDEVKEIAYQDSDYHTLYIGEVL
ncbi:MAG: flavin reductase family protein [Clostridia bacterium]|nr:flavin reductase family protein [Clostridia bacterium]